LIGTFATPLRSRNGLEFAVSAWECALAAIDLASASRARRSLAD
jgi:hypothetical protein